ncbi:MAG: YicC family protein [Bacteroidales bacterium]|nr:YicC family protein [Bacteroidales bacterium]
MLKSMTGYGKISEVKDSKKIIIEIKSLNSKSFNPYIKIPELYNEKEIDIKNILFNNLKGGKINFTMQIEDENSINNILNKKTVNNYLNQLTDIAEENKIDIKNEQILQAVLRLPDILTTEELFIDENEWTFIRELINKAILKIDSFRLQEGKVLEKDIIEKIIAIKELIPKIESFEDERIESVKNRLNIKLNDYINLNEQNKDRFEQEIIYYLDKFDINEEKIRLKNHCEYFTETMKSKEPVGTKLGFIAQEIGREINTIGSKANHSEIQKTVVIMKDNLGKAKEQLLNVL